ncbi:ArdC family protein [Dongia sedimenti]
MARNGGRRSSGDQPIQEGAGRPSLYQEVTDRIVRELEAGRVPWVQPWGSTKAAPGLPKNAATGRAYSGVNILILWGSVTEAGYPTQHWLTFRQALTLGGHVMKGESGTTVCYADRFTPRSELERVAREGGEADTVPFLKRFTVFNAAQCDGLPEHLLAPAPQAPEREIIPSAEAVIAATGADLRIGGDKAFYVPAEDYIRVPPQSAFFHQIDYYRTCFHELGHWTGHASRLNRGLSSRMGSNPYAREELVAEMASAFLCAHLGIVPTVRHADYLGTWLTCCARMPASSSAPPVRPGRRRISCWVARTRQRGSGGRRRNERAVSGSERAD